MARDDLGFIIDHRQHCGDVIPQSGSRAAHWEIYEWVTVEINVLVTGVDDVRFLKKDYCIPIGVSGIAEVDNVYILSDPMEGDLFLEGQPWYCLSGVRFFAKI